MDETHGSILWSAQVIGSNEGAGVGPVVRVGGQSSKEGVMDSHMMQR